MVDVALELMDIAAPDERFLVMGQSWGGYLARGVVHHRHKQVDGAVFYVPAIYQGEEQSPLPAKQVIRHDPAFSAALQPGEEWLPDLLVVQTMPILDDLRANYLPRMTPQDPALGGILDGKSFKFDPSHLPEPCPAPALFVMGRQDHWAGYKDAWSVLDNFPRGTFAILDRAGHFLPGEQPQLSVALLNEWLDRVEEYIAQKTH
jgi:pimeloyl-ACP methyl ester carboxylesterase